MVGIDLATGKVEWCFQDLFGGCVSGCQVQQEGSDRGVVCWCTGSFVDVVDNDVSGEWYLCVFDSLCQRLDLIPSSYAHRHELDLITFNFPSSIIQHCINTKLSLLSITSGKLAAMARSTYVEALLGADTFAKVRNTKILVVGAGGIGCELRELPHSSSYKTVLMNSQKPRPSRICQYRNRKLHSFAQIQKS